MKKKKLLAKLSKATKRLVKAEAKVTKLKSRIAKTEEPQATGTAAAGVAEQSLKSPAPAKEAGPAKKAKSKPILP